jgi:hypothetical protein
MGDYLLFKMRKDRIASLLHSMNYHKNLLESHGYKLTGAFPKFIDEVHDLLRRYERSKPQDRKQG